LHRRMGYAWSEWSPVKLPRIDSCLRMSVKRLVVVGDQETASGHELLSGTKTNDFLTILRFIDAVTTMSAGMYPDPIEVTRLQSSFSRGGKLVWQKLHPVDDCGGVGFCRRR
jgi:hypothetical protein